MQNIKYKNITDTPRTVWLGGLLLLLLVAMPPLYAGAPAPFSKLVIFGDSLTDPGNAFAITGGVATAPFDPIPGAAYAIGGHHFSNGVTWAEHLTRKLQLGKDGANSVKPAFAEPGNFTNYAVGGARTASGPVSLTTQVGAFLGDFGGVADPDALYIIWIGGNDVRDALEALLVSGLPAAAAIITSAVGAEAANIGALVAAGATQFLILNAPNVGLVPGVTSLGPLAVGAAMFLSAAYNTGLTAALDGLESAFPFIDIVRFDTFAFLSTVVADPAAFGLENTLDSCITPGVTAGAFCNKAKGFLFWDFIHPTEAGHKLLGTAVGDVLP